MFDGFHRKIDYIRLSVTDRCDLRCRYCMPPEGVPSMAMDELLTYEELLRLCRIFADMGIRKIKVTGGEPFVRKDICTFLAELRQIPGIESLTLTTNGMRIGPELARLRDIPVDGINFSLDTLNPDTFYKITRRHGHEQVMAAIRDATAMDFDRIKINCVPMAGINDAEIPAIAELARQYPVHVRFIEMMPIGLGRQFNAVPEAEIRRRLEEAYGVLLPVHEALGNGPAIYSHIPGFQGHIGFISAMSHRFCEDCNRIRLTSDGQLKTCLFYADGIDLRYLLRKGDSDAAITRAITQTLMKKPEHHDLQNQMPESKGMSQIGG